MQAMTDTNTALPANVVIEQEADGDILFGKPEPRKRPALALLPQFVVKETELFPDVTEEEQAAIFGRLVVADTDDTIDEPWLGDDGWML